MKITHFLLLVAFILTAIFSSSCRKESFTTSGALEFNKDTVMFDTVFTTIGSATRSFKVYNRQNDNIRISRIYLAGGETSKFRMNIDGVSGRNFSDIEIAPNDSIWGFVEVTLDPNNTNTPLVVTDSIVFETNGVTQDIDLVAFGQDAYFHFPGPNDSTIVFNLNCDEHWFNDKPHVIYGFAQVKKGCSLTMDPGTRVYIHRYSGIYVNEGSLFINGTQTDSVTIQGDRLELDYRDLPGQWEFIRLLKPAAAKIDYAIIKNANIGILADTFSVAGPNYEMFIRNTQILNMAAIGFFGRGSKVLLENCVLANAGQSAAAFAYGGNYRANNCTFANYYSYSTRNTPCVVLNNYFKDENDLVFARNLDEATFQNCLIYGSNPSEMEFDKDDGASFTYQFNYCLFRVKDDFDVSDLSKFNNVLKNPAGDSLFVDYFINNYHLRASSVARNKGSLDFLTSQTQNDLDGNSRTLDGTPDLGAYEFKE
jgi:hypothetical protein